jgi:hypothetical protein
LKFFTTMSVFIRRLDTARRLIFNANTTLTH